MATKRDAGMMERLERVETKVDWLDTKVDHLETRFDRLEVRFDHLETRFDGLEIRFDGLETRVDGLASKIDVDHLRDDIRLLGESFAGVLERMERRHMESQAEANRRFADYGLVLQDHSRRITTLERPPTRLQP